MEIAVLAVLSLWCAVYTGSTAVHAWRRGNKAGAVGVALLALLVLCLPPVVPWLSRWR